MTCPNHEAKLPEDVRFVKESPSGNIGVKIQDSILELTHSWMTGLNKAVEFAPENAQEFVELHNLPDDVLRWFLFGHRREGQHVPEYIAKRQEFAERWQARNHLPA